MSIGKNTGVVPVLRCPIHNGSHEKADCDAKLVASNNCTSDPFGQSLGLVHGNCDKISYGF